MNFDDSINRYSMPVTRSRTGMYDIGLDQTNTTRFLFGDEETNAGGHSGPDANFPTLVRHDDQIVSIFIFFHLSNFSSSHFALLNWNQLRGCLVVRLYSGSYCFAPTSRLTTRLHISP